MDISQIYKESTISEEAKQHNPVMANFDTMEEYELWRYCQGLHSVHDDNFFLTHPSK